MKKILIITTILLIAGLGFFQFSKPQNNKWKTYINNKYSYEVKYPQDWGISGTSNTKIVDNKPDLLEGNYVFFIKSGQGAVTIKIWPNPNNASPSDWYNHEAENVLPESAANLFPYPSYVVASSNLETVGKMSAYKIITTGGSMDYVFTKPGYAFVMSFEMADQETNSVQLRKIFEDILNSFTFL